MRILKSRGAAITVGLSLIAGAAFFISKSRAKPSQPRKRTLTPVPEDKVDEASLQSFPASDPPAY